MRLASPRLVLLCAFGLALVSFPAAAGRLVLTVVDPQGAPVPFAAVCHQFPSHTIGGRMTDGQGRHEFDLPSGQDTMLVYKNGFTNQSQVIAIPVDGTVTSTVTLVPGSNPANVALSNVPAACSGVSLIPGNACNVVTSFGVTGGQTSTSPQVIIDMRFTERPKSYRVLEYYGDRADKAFQAQNPPWHPMLSGSDNAVVGVGLTLTQPTRYGTMYGKHTVYVQTAKHPLNNCVSDPKVAAVILAPSALRQYVVTGTDVANFVSYAESQGYDFSVTPELTTNNIPGVCAAGNIEEPELPVLRYDNVKQELKGNYEVFFGPGLMPYWKMLSIDAGHPELRDKRDSLGSELIVTSKEINRVTPGFAGRYAQFRVNYKRKLFNYQHCDRIGIGGNGIGCSPPGNNQVSCYQFPQGFRLTRIVLEGPVGLTARDALVPPQ